MLIYSSLGQSNRSNSNKKSKNYVCLHTVLGSTESKCIDLKCSVNSVNSRRSPGSVQVGLK